MSYSLALHMVGIVMWLGGMMLLTRLVKLSAQNDALVSMGPSLNRAFRGFVLPGLILATVSGLYQVTSMGFGVYMKQGWFHGKLTLLILLFVLTFFVSRTMKAAADGDTAVAMRAGRLHAATGFFLVVIIFLTYIGRISLS